MTKPTPPPAPAPPTEPQYTYCPGCRRRIQPGQSVEAVEHGDPWQSLWHTKCRPVPAPVDFVDELIAEGGPEFAAKVEKALARRRAAPVDVEAVVRRFHHLPCKLCRPGPGQLCARALDIRAAVQFVLAARSAPADAALLAQCREALEAADEDYKGRGYPCDDITCSQTVCARAAQVRAALLAINEKDKP